MPDITKELSNGNVTQMVTDANQLSLLIWAIVIIIFVFAMALIIITKTFVNNTNKTNEGYKELMKQNSDNISDFRKSVDTIGEVLRSLSERIATSQILYQNETEKFDILMRQNEDLRTSVIQQIQNLTVAFSEHDRVSSEHKAQIQETLKQVAMESKNSKMWCMMKYSALPEGEDSNERFDS